jgi:hypothetical protein
LVQRTPPTADSQSTSGQSSQTRNSPFNAAASSAQTTNDVQRMVQQLIGGLGQNASINTITNVSRF